MRKRFAFITVCAALFICACSPAAQTTAAVAADETEEELFRITSIDVGKGDCLLVQTGSHNVVIDSGYNSTSDIVIDHLKKCGIEDLDAMIISHYDKDHVGGADEIIENFSVSKLYLPDYAGTGKGYKNMMKAAQKAGVSFESVKDDSSFSLGDAEYCLYPSTLKFTGDDDNDMSLAASVRYHGYSALFTGDMEDEEMSGFIAGHEEGFEKCDILKMPHHGSSDEMTQALIVMVSPDIVLVTDGKKRKMEEELRTLLDEKRIKYYTSLKDGTITVTGGEEPKYTVTTTSGSAD